MGQIVKFVELVHDCILSKQQRNEMNRRYCDAIFFLFFCLFFYILVFKIFCAVGALCMFSYF